MSLLAAAAALITAVVAGGLSIILVAAHVQPRRAAPAGPAGRRHPGDRRGRASATASAAGPPDAQRPQDRLCVGRPGRAGDIGQRARPRRGDRRAWSATLLAGGSVSQTGRVDGQQVYIEGRKINTGAIVLVQKRSDAVAVGQRAVRWILLALGDRGRAGDRAGAVRRLAAGPSTATYGGGGPRPGRRSPRRHRVPRRAGRGGRGRRRAERAGRGPGSSEAREREFLLSVSHDLRTPLTAISGYAESLADGMIAPERTQEVGGVLLAESQRLGRLVADLLDLARLGAQEFRVDLIELDLARVRAARPRRCGRPLRGGRGARSTSTARPRSLTVRPTRPGCGRRWTGCSTTRCGSPRPALRSCWRSRPEAWRPDRRRRVARSRCATAARV